MGKEEIKKIIENSKRELENEYDGFCKYIKDDLNSFKKKALEKI